MFATTLSQPVQNLHAQSSGPSTTPISGIMKDDSTKDCGNDDDESWPEIPPGANIIRLLAAEEILFQLLDRLPGRRTGDAINFEEIAYLARAFPGAFRKKHNFRWEDDTSYRELFPLSILSCLGPDLSTFQAVYHAYPNAIQEIESSRGSLPFHFLCAFEADASVVHFAHSVYPEAIRTPRYDGVYPIHLSSNYYRGEPSVLNFLLDEYPDGAKQVTEDTEWTVMHTAASACVSDRAVLQRIYDLHPEALIWQDISRKLPLHLACESKHDDVGTIIEFLVEKSPQAVAVGDELDHNPLVIASACQNAEIVEMILDLAAPDTQVVDPETGLTILHWAAAFGQHEVVYYLARRFPDMPRSQTFDESQDTPVSFAFHNRASIENIRVLLQICPDAMLLTDGRGRTLLQGALLSRKAANDQTVELLIQEFEKLELSRKVPDD